MRVTITVNNGSMTKKQAIKDAREVHDQTSVEVLVENAIGDTILWIKKNGTEVKF